MSVGDVCIRLLEYESFQQSTEDRLHRELAATAPVGSVVRSRRPARSNVVLGNDTVPKIILNDTVSLFLKTAISISVISNRNSSRVLFDKIDSVYFI